MEVRYRRELNESFLILEETTPGDTYSIRILIENQITGLLSLQVKQVDGNPAYYYEVSGKQTLQRLLEKRQITCEEIRQILFGIHKILEQMEEYLLDVNYILLEPEFLYVNPDFSQVFLCFHPGHQGDFFSQMRGLTQYFLNKIDHMEENSVQIAYELFRISNEEFFCFDHLLEALGEKEEVLKDIAVVISDSWEIPEEEKTDISLVKTPPKKKSMLESFLIVLVGFTAIACAYVFGPLDVLQGSLKAGVLLMAVAVVFILGLFFRSRNNQKKNEIQTDSPLTSAYEKEMQGDEMTAYLQGDFQTLPRERVLISQNSLRHASIRIDKMPFVIGKMEGVSNYQIKSTVISRVHARIEQQNDSFYLVDCNSTNGTFLGGMRLDPNRRYLIKEGDEVEFANIKFIFQ